MLSLPDLTFIRGLPIGPPPSALPLRANLGACFLVAPSRLSCHTRQVHAGARKGPRKGESQGF